MRRIAIILLTMAGVTFAMALAASSHTRGVPTQALLKGMSLSDKASGNGLFLRIEGDYSFQVAQASGDTVFIDLRSVQAASVPTSGRWADELIAGYRLLTYTDAAHQPVLRVQVELKRPEPFKVQREPAGLRMLFGQNAGLESTPGAVSPVPVSAPPVALAAGAAARPSILLGGPTVVSSISIRAESNGEAVIDVLTSRPTSYRVLHLENPPRVVVDLEGAQYSAHQRNYAAESAVLKGVRVGQFRASNPAVVRVVADLSGNPIFDVHAQPGGVRIELRLRSLARQSAVSRKAQVSAPRTTKAAEKPQQLASPRSIPPAPVDRNEQEVVPAQEQPTASKVVAVKPEPQPAPHADYQSVLPAPAGSKEVTAAPRVEPPPQTPGSLRAAKAAQILTGGTEISSGASQGQTPAGVPNAPEKSQFTGEPISLNLKDVDLKDFFRLIHEISGLNIIVDPNVSGNVTLVLDGVPWDQALDIVLKNNRLDKTLEGNVLRIARIDTLSSEQEAAKKLVEARQEAQPLVTVFRHISYAKSSTISTILKSWVGGGALTKRGNILVDERSNTLIISDIQSQIPVIESIVSKLDKKAKQISIEARIVLATSTFARNLSSVLAGATSNKSGSTVLAGSTGIPNVSAAASSSGTNSFPPTPTPPPLVTTAAASGFGVFAIANASSRYAINAAIGAAETKNQAKTISRPSIVTQNNVLGMVQQGSQIPIQTTINNTISIQYVAATLQLSVTPQVTDDGNIFMIINVNNASPGQIFGISGNPSINTQQATTQVLVPDGGTVIFGGVTVTVRSRSATYVPVIGSIPVLGHLFKNSILQDQDNELLFFVSPKILPG